MRACGPFLLRKGDIIAVPQASIDAEVFTIVERINMAQRPSDTELPRVCETRSRVATNF